MHVTMEISSAAPSTLMEGGGMDECGDGWEEDCFVLIVFWGEDGVGLCIIALCSLALSSVF